ncbi:MAG: DsbA family protein [Alphaproteobacteria bacterium]|nr:DsbA family protein [Alphaproteobacteria bacterium]
MSFTFKHAVWAVVALVGVAMLPLLASRAGAETQAESAASFTAAQKQEIGEVVRAYLLENPGVIFEAADKHREKMEASAAKESEAGIGENLEWMTRSDAPSVGSKTPDVTVVEFFDYNCGYCTRALPDIQNIIKTDANVRFVFFEIPILGPTSKTAALWSLAAARQNKYFEFHVAVMNHKGPKDEGELEKIAKTVGLDVDRVKKDLASGEIEEALNKNIEISRKIGVQGTPAFVVGTTFIPGYIGEEGLKQAIAEQRKKK